MSNSPLETTKKLLKGHEFEKLFRHLGWDHFHESLTVSVEGVNWTLRGVAEKRSIAVYCCAPAADGTIPPRSVRQKIETQVRRFKYEHLLIFVNANRDQQVWQWTRNERGRPKTSREYAIHSGQSGLDLAQRLDRLRISLEEEEELRVTDVVSRVQASFDVERVTRRFYDRFKEEHKGFLRFLRGIPEETLQHWYASVMLNRLMFVYFIQKKGFLEGDLDYLRHKLHASQQQAPDRFYQDFLCPLFFEGFALPVAQRSAQAQHLLGNVPYLNGGIFQRHQIEEAYGQKIELPDAAFERIFNFFDEYRWHLDERPLRNDNEINPDVLGYIFEKYINQKQMGAYYTKEDITGYIGRNTILPCLLEKMQQECRVAFEGPQSIWRLLQDDPNRYIYPSLRSGVFDSADEVIPESALPDFVQTGMHDPQARMFDRRYNLGSAELSDAEGRQLTLPTETWREYVERRRRCLELHQKLSNGEIHEINDLITYNLDIEQFVQDVIETSEGPELIRAAWKALRGLKILDPTCGSGAFLFAALNLLEPLYEAVYDRMRAFLDEAAGDAAGDAIPNLPHGRMKDFSEALQQAAKHPNGRYAILKAIIVNNLYGVDIMEEAVEICKLRLFLKLVAQVDSAENIEPLPDIDFNIRAGNTLVGFTSLEEVRQAMMSDGQQIRVLWPEEEAQLRKIEETGQEVKQLFEAFQVQQIEWGGEVTTADKEALRSRLQTLNDELDVLLGHKYGIKETEEARFDAWKQSHRPFHWFSEFYGIVQAGGFDVVIGNPPYVNYSKSKFDYEVHNYSTLECSNLYAFVAERGLQVSGNKSRVGLIVMLNLTFSEDYASLRKYLHDNTSHLWLSSYDNIPDGLFAGSVKSESSNTNKVVSQRVCIVIGSVGKTRTPLLFTSNFLRWNSGFRPHIFQTLHFGYYPMPERSKWYALGSETSVNIYSRLFVANSNLGSLISDYGSEFLQLGATPRYFISAVPEQLNRSGIVEIRFIGRIARQLAETILNSNLFYWFWRSGGDGFHLTRSNIYSFPIEPDFLLNAGLLEKVTAALTEVRDSCRTSKLNKGKVSYNVNYNLAPKVVSELDGVLAKYYDLSPAELDFILNYDIKYRLGAGEEDEG